MRLGRLAHTRYVEYDLADGSTMRRATISLDIAVFDVIGNVVADWTRTTVYIEPGDNECLSGITFSQGCYTWNFQLRSELGCSLNSNGDVI